MLAVLAVGGSRFARGDVAPPGEGEIRLSGEVVAVDAPAMSLSLTAYAFATARGSAEIEPPKPKAVVLTAETRFAASDGGAAKLADVRPGQCVAVYGKDSGTGKPLTARLVVLQRETGSQLYGARFRSAVATEPQPGAQDDFLLTLAHGGQVQAVAFAPDGALLASAGGYLENGRESGRPGEVKLWEMPSGTLRQTLAGHTATVYGVAFSRDGKTLATSADHAIRVWDARTARLVRIIQPPGDSPFVNALALSPDATLVAAGWDTPKGFNLSVWGVGEGDLKRALTGHEDFLRSVAFSPDGSLLASGAQDATARLWDVATGALVRTLEHGPDGSRAYGTWPFKVSSVAFSPDGKVLATGCVDSRVRLWDVRTGALGKTMSAHTGCVLSVAFSPDGARLASGDSDGTIKVWDRATGSVRNQFHCTGAVDAVAFSADGRLLAVGCDDGTVRVADSDAGEGPTAWDALMTGDAAALARMIEADPELIGQQFDTTAMGMDRWGGGTLLHWAIAEGQLEALAQLLQHGADVNAKGQYGRTPLFWAASGGNPWLPYPSTPLDMTETIKRLLDSKADVDAKDDRLGRTPLHQAAFGARARMVQLLLAHQADANAQDARGQTALHLAVIMGGRPGAAEVAKALLAHGADPNLEDAEGATPLTLAVKGNHTELLDLLRRHGGQE